MSSISRASSDTFFAIISKVCPHPRRAAPGRAAASVARRSTGVEGVRSSWERAARNSSLAREAALACASLACSAASRSRSSSLARFRSAVRASTRASSSLLAPLQRLLGLLALGDFRSRAAFVAASARVLRKRSTKTAIFDFRICGLIGFVR